MGNVVDYLVKNLEANDNQCARAFPLTVLEAMAAQLHIIATAS